MRGLLGAMLYFVVLPNAPLWLMAQYLDLARAPVNLDYVLLGVVFALGRVYWGAALFVLCWSIDLLMLAGQVFPFMRLQDVIYLSRLLPHAPLAYVLLAILLLLCLSASAWLQVRYGRRLSMLSALVVLNLALLMYGINVYGNSAAPDRNWLASTSKTIDSQSIDFINLRLGGFMQSFALDGPAFQPTGYRGQTAEWAEAPAGSLSPKLLLVVAESWGSMTDERTQQAILRPLLDKAGQLENWRSGEMPFVGATVAAEFRELCGQWPLHFNLKNVTDGFSDCLPNRLRAQGYATAAVHGAVGLMYDRMHWYPRAGFETADFRETQPWQSRCHSFPGVCDREILHDFVIPAFRGDGKRFVYWLTLNTHATYSPRDLHGDYLDCSTHDLPEHGAACRMAKLHAQFFHDLAQALDDPAMQGVEVLVVGDHEPPLGGAEQREAIKEKTVSWVGFRVAEED